MTSALSASDSWDTDSKQDADGGRADPRARELERLLRGDIPAASIEELRKLLKDPVFQRQEGLTDAEVATLAYRRTRFLARALRLTGAEVQSDPTPRRGSLRALLLTAMDRVQTGRVCFTSAAVSTLRAATWIAMRSSTQGLTFAPGRRNTPLFSYRNVPSDVFGALSSAYALTFAMRCVQKRFRERTAQTEEDSFREVAMFKAMATSEAADMLARLRERCGAVGLLSENRILEYWTQMQGVITAEGDNRLMLLRVGRELREVARDEPSLPSRVDDLTALDPKGCVSLLRFREARMKQELCGKTASDRGARGTFAVWNENVNRTIVLGATYGERFIAECFEAQLGSTRNAEVGDWLRTLFSLWSLNLLERYSGWFMAEGCFTNRVVKQMPRFRDRLCAAIEPHAPALVEAFGFENSSLRAPANPTLCTETRELARKGFGPSSAVP